MAALATNNKQCHSFNQIKEYACTCYASSQLKIIAKYVWTYVISFGGTICSSLPITASRISLFVLPYLTVVSVPAKNHNIYEPSMPALVKASSNITVHYRNSICTITVVQTTFTYVIETTYSQNTAKCGGIAVHTLRLTTYSQYSQLKLVHWKHLK
jgi:hypothetical protein